jgi:hypothetical protein
MMAFFAPDFAGASCYVILCLKTDKKNMLYFGDNLKILREYVADASVRLATSFGPFRRFNLAHLGTLLVG